MFWYSVWYQVCKSGNSQHTCQLNEKPSSYNKLFKCYSSFTFKEIIYEVYWLLRLL